MSKRRFEERPQAASAPPLYKVHRVQPKHREFPASSSAPPACTGTAGAFVTEGHLHLSEYVCRIVKALGSEVRGSLESLLASTPEFSLGFSAVGRNALCWLLGLWQRRLKILGCLCTTVGFLSAARRMLYSESSCSKCSGGRSPCSKMHAAWIRRLHRTQATVATCQECLLATSSWPDSHVKMCPP